MWKDATALTTAATTTAATRTDVTEPGHVAVVCHHAACDGHHLLKLSDLHDHLVGLLVPVRLLELVVLRPGQSGGNTTQDIIEGNPFRGHVIISFRHPIRFNVQDGEGTK